MANSVSEKMELLKSCLVERGLKSTHQRDYIAATFFKSNTHISLEELLSKVRKKNPKVGYATVYRTMKLLRECGLAISRHFGDGQTRYENIPKTGHHDHIICINCSKIAEFQCMQIEELQNEMAKKHGFKIINHKLELYGYCRDCK